MAGISRFQQQQLASSLVGTPGVDKSGAILSQSIESVTAGQASAALGAERQFQAQSDRATAISDYQANTLRSQAIGEIGGAVQDASYVIASRMAQDARNEAAQQQAQNQIDVATESSNVNTSIGATEAAIKAKYYGDPGKAPEAFTKQAKEDLSNYLEDSGMAPEVKAAVYKSALERITSKSDALNNWKFDRGLAGTDEKIKGAADTLLQQVEKHPLNEEVYNQAVRDLDSQSQAYLDRYGGEAGIEMAKAKAKIAEAYASPMTRNDPVRLMEQIDNGEFAGKMPQEKIDSFYAKAVAQTNTNRIKASQADELDHQGRMAYLTATEADVQGKLQDDPQQQLDTWNELDVMRQQHQEHIKDNPMDPTNKYRGEELKRIIDIQQMIDNKMKAAETAAAQLQREETKEQKDARDSAEKAAKAKAIEQWQGQDVKRGEVAATFALFSADSKVKGSSEELQQTIKAHHQLQELMASHGLVAPGERSNLPGHYMALIQERLKRIAVAAGASSLVPGETPPSAIKSEAEKQLELMTRPAPQVLQDALNPHGHNETSGHIRRAWTDKNQEAVDQWNEYKGRPEGSIPPVAELLVLQKAIAQKMLTSPQMIPAGTSKYGIKGQAYKFTPEAPNASDLGGGVPTEGAPTAPAKAGKGLVNAPPATAPNLAGGAPGIIPAPSKPPSPTGKAITPPMFTVPKPSASETVAKKTPHVAPLAAEDPRWKAYEARQRQLGSTDYFKAKAAEEARTPSARAKAEAKAKADEEKFLREAKAKAIKDYAENPFMQGVHSTGVIP